LAGPHAREPALKTFQQFTIEHRATRNGTDPMVLTVPADKDLD
jgi:hypothetical protein